MHLPRLPIGQYAGAVSLAVLLCGSAQAEITLSASETKHLHEAYLHLHQNPELSFYEEKTAGYLTRELKTLGFDVAEKVGRFPKPVGTSHGFVAVMKNGPGPKVLIRTDLDALPVVEQTKKTYASKKTTKNDAGEKVGVMHACGHDIHMTVFLGTARYLSQHKDQWSGTVIMLGQPAEERGSGAKAMLSDNLYRRFGKPDYAIALHVDASMPAGSIGVAKGYAMANVDSVDVKLVGRGGHGAYPHTTIDPVVMSAQFVLGVQTLVSRTISPLKPGVVTVGSIHGGTKHNVIADDVRLQLTVRSYESEVRKQLLEGIKRVAKGVVAMAGLPDSAAVVDIDEAEFTPSLYNNPALATRLETMWTKDFGDKYVLVKEPVMGGEDFSRYTLEDHSIPSTMFWLGSVAPKALSQYKKKGVSPPSLHSNRFAPDYQRAIPTGVKAMSLAALELLKSR